MASLNDGRAELYTLTSLCGTLTISPFTQANCFTLGRGPSCSYRVSGEHGWVSEKHCRLSHNGGLSYFGLDVEHKTTCDDTSKNGVLLTMNLLAKEIPGFLNREISSPLKWVWILCHSRAVKCRFWMTSGRQVTLQGELNTPIMIIY